MPRLAAGIFLAVMVLLASASESFAQQIVSDPELDAQLLAFEQNFNQFVVEHPQLSHGSSQPLHVEGKKGKITYTYDVQGTYTVTYQSLDLSPADPISENRFRLTLSMESIVISGDAAMVVSRKSTTWALDCPDNEITLSNVVYTAEVEVQADGTVRILDPDVAIDRNAVSVVVPCLGGSSARAAMGDPALGTDEIVDALGAEVSGSLASTAAPPGQTPPRNVANKVNTSLQSTAAQPDSEVMNEASSTAETAGASVAASAASACSETVQADVEAVVAEITAIAEQADSQGFSAAMDAFASDLQVILPTLTPPAQETVRNLIDDIDAATAEDGPGGSTITPLEQFELTNGLYAVLLSTGISTEDLLTIQSDLAALLDSLAGISTDQLQASLAQLAADLQTCAASR